MRLGFETERFSSFVLQLLLFAIIIVEAERQRLAIGWTLRYYNSSTFDVRSHIRHHNDNILNSCALDIVSLSLSYCQHKPLAITVDISLILDKS